MDTTTDPVRTAHARLAALKRHRPDDTAAIRAAKRALVVAQAAALTAKAAGLLTQSEAR